MLHYIFIHGRVLVVGLTKNGILSYGKQRNLNDLEVYHQIQLL